LGNSHDSLLQASLRELSQLQAQNSAKRVFEPGCGKDSEANVMSEQERDRAGVDLMAITRRP
jgi:hypothetical protein